jgi:hypothetical protein
MIFNNRADVFIYKKTNKKGNYLLVNKQLPFFKYFIFNIKIINILHC